MSRDYPRHCQCLEIFIARSATSVRALLKSIASVCLYVCPDKMDAKNDSQISISRTKNVAEGIRSECFNRVFLPHKYRLVEAVVGFPGSENSVFWESWNMFSLNKPGDATTRHRTDLETEWRHRTFPGASRPCSAECYLVRNLASHQPFRSRREFRSKIKSRVN